MLPVAGGMRTSAPVAVIAANRDPRNDVARSCGERSSSVVTSRHRKVERQGNAQNWEGSQVDIGRIERIIVIERIDGADPVRDPQPAQPLDPDAVPV